MYCENEKETNSKSKSKVEKRILKHIKFTSLNQEKYGELKSSDPLIPNESACKLLIENSISKDNQNRSKSIKNSSHKTSQILEQHCTSAIPELRG